MIWTKYTVSASNTGPLLLWETWSEIERLGMPLALRFYLLSVALNSNQSPVIWHSSFNVGSWRKIHEPSVACPLYLP